MRIKNNVCMRIKAIIELLNQRYKDKSKDLARNITILWKKNKKIIRNVKE